jgi:hypothetical protein
MINNHLDYDVAKSKLLSLSKKLSDATWSKVELEFRMKSLREEIEVIEEDIIKYEFNNKKDRDRGS